jgi:hypothetical protein
VPPAGNLLNWADRSAHEELIICAEDKHYRRSVWRKKVLSHSDLPFIYLFVYLFIFIALLQIKNKMSLEDLTVVTIKNAVCWVLMPFILL